jgi:hypothetical protein
MQKDKPRVPPLFSHPDLNLSRSDVAPRGMAE